MAGDGQGRVVVGGFSGQLQSGTRPDFAVVVFDTNGQSSTTFGDSGVVLTNRGRFPFQTSEAATNDVMAIQPDGKFLVAGSGSTMITGFDFVVLRYNADGSLDPTFGEGGIVVVDFGYTNDYATGVAVDSHGRVVVAGYSIDNQLGPSDDAVVWVVRLKADGRIDPSFDGDGKQTVDFGGTDERAYGVAVDSQDRVIVAGYTSGSSTGLDFAVARLDAFGRWTRASTVTASRPSTSAARTL